MDVKALHCPDCGAPVGEGDLRCASCGSHLLARLCPACFAFNPGTDTHCAHCGQELPSLEAAAEPILDGRPCPGCGEGLHRTMQGETELLECLACGGLWMGHQAFERLGDRALAHPTGGVADAISPELRPLRVTAEDLNSVHYRKCPACQAMMNRKTYAQISGVVLDLCKPHGLWFDRDELSRVLRFIQMGGLQKAAVFQAQAGPAAMAPIQVSQLPPLPPDAARSPLELRPEDLPQEALVALAKVTHVAQSVARAGLHAFRAWYYQ